MELEDAGGGVVAPGAARCSDLLYDRLWYLASLMFSTLDNLAENRQLYTLEDEELGNWAEVTKCR